MSLALPFGALLALLLAVPAAPDEPAPGGDAEAERSVPEPFEPFSALVGRWKGQAVPADNPLRGWRELHEWSYAFEDGRPVAMTLTIEGGKVVESARLTHDEESGTYRLVGTDPEGKPVAFEGARDEKTNALTLDRDGPEGEDRLTIRPNSNGVRADFWFDRKAPGSPQFSRLVRANLGKEGVSFAAGGAASSDPECIVTGGSATITVSAGGSTFAVCCTGCRDEVLADPEKYAKKLRESSRAPKEADAPAESEPTPEPSGDTPETPDPTPDPTPDDPEPDDAEIRRQAASWLRLGRSLERQGKADGALTFYRRVVSEAPDTPEAEAAAARIEALGGDD